MKATEKGQVVIYKGSEGFWPLSANKYLRR
jgi:hypothetical protein